MTYVKYISQYVSYICKSLNELKIRDSYLKTADTIQFKVTIKCVTSFDVLICEETRFKTYSVVVVPNCKDRCSGF